MRPVVTLGTKAVNTIRGVPQDPVTCYLRWGRVLDHKGTTGDGVRYKPMLQIGTPAHLWYLDVLLGINGPSRSVLILPSQKHWMDQGSAWQVHNMHTLLWEALSIALVCDQ